MRSLPLYVALAAIAVGADAQSIATSTVAPVIEVSSSSTQPAATGAADHFTGAALISAPFQALAPGKAGGATVRFAPGARTAWHSHPLGQTLIVTAGGGLVQQQGQPARLIHAGDVVVIPANVLHWHGAGPNDPMTHVAIAEKENGVSVIWQSKVTDDDYLAAWSRTGVSPAIAARSRAYPASETLSARQRLIPVIAAFAASSDMQKLNSALGQGLDAGLSINETKEILVQLYAYAGFPRSLNALGELLKVVELRKQRGIADTQGREPGRVLATGAELVAVGKANQTEISGGPVQGAVFDFAPTINQFLQAHLFGDIFERDNLDWQSRELATVGALAATPGAEAQLRSHMRASLRVGLSAAQLHQLSRILADHICPETGARASEALSQALAAASKG
ncbi:carboxymuconolactone decarboxylase family protein [Herbaspirillum lusitanum]|uniref:Carboxymuconolactone decarboxylase family protein n=1 Tax=Herbaspirillum lusitanum TaxID=213312 RepID=A0ABW9ADF1_9BURK